MQGFTIGSIVAPTLALPDFEVPAEVIGIRPAKYEFMGHATEYEVLNGGGTPDKPRENVSARWYHGSQLKLSPAARVLRVVNDTLVWANTA